MSKYSEGYNAYNDRKTHNACPYHPTTPQADEWYQGWEQAQLDDESSTNES
jgi:ribosome modulation factor